MAEACGLGERPVREQWTSVVWIPVLADMTTTTILHVEVK
jgi:hypothetical protein